MPPTAAAGASAAQPSSPRRGLRSRRPSARSASPAAQPPKPPDPFNPTATRKESRIGNQHSTSRPCAALRRDHQRDQPRPGRRRGRHQARRARHRRQGDRQEGLPEDHDRGRPVLGQRRDRQGVRLRRPARAAGRVPGVDLLPGRGRQPVPQRPERAPPVPRARRTPGGDPMTESTAAAEVVRDLATVAARPHRLDLENYYAIALPHGGVEQIDLTGDKWRDFPRRKAGIVTVRNVDSFVQYYAKHADEDSEVFADVDRGTVTAVLDAHRDHEATGRGDGDAARWQEHRLVLQLQPTLPWRRWTGKNEQMMPQQQFAEFVEDNARDVDPQGRVKAADLLEIAQKFQAHTTVKFTSGKRLSSGEAQFQYIEETTASSKTDRGEITIPVEFDLAIWPYEDAKPESAGDVKIIAARFRYRIENGTLKLGYFLNDPARFAQEAVER